MSQIAIERLEPKRFGDVLSLLARSGLPLDGLADHQHTTLVARQEDAIVGSAALELYGNAALLRSVAVDQARRGQGVGKRLAHAALEMARQHGVKQVYLLTETAADYFQRLGFHPIERHQADSAVQMSVEFTSACPQSAQTMMLELV
jgi:amino-acid N-acetyltransferase